MTDEDREEVNKMTRDIRVLSFSAIILVNIILFILLIKNWEPRITALEAQVKELKEHKP